MGNLLSNKRRPIIHTISFALAIFSAFVLAADPANAKWEIAPKVSLGLSNDDNFFFRSDAADIESVSGSALRGDARFSYDSERSKFSITPGIRIDKYDSATDLDSEASFLNFRFSRAGQLSNVAFAGNFTDDTVRRGEQSSVDFDVEDPEDIPADDSGRVLTIGNRQRLLLRPSWLYRTGQKARLSLAARYLDTRYDANLTGILRDYTEYSLIPSFSYSLSERNSVGLSGYARQTEFDGIAKDNKGYGFRLNYRQRFSETMNVIYGIGVDSSKNSTGATQSNPIAELSIVRRFQSSQLLASYRRSVQGSGLGVVSARDSVTLKLTRNMSERFKVGAGLRAYQTNKLGGAVEEFDDRLYFQFAGQFIWKLSRTFSLDFDYRFTHLETDLSGRDADSNEVTLWLSYSPSPRRN